MKTILLKTAKKLIELLAATGLGHLAQQLITLGYLIRNKAHLVALLWLQVTLWSEIPDGAEIPFSSVRYALIVMNAGAVLIPLCRWFLFHEAARYAERGGLDRQLGDLRLTATDEQKHYWFATTICTVIVAVAFFAKA